MLRLVALGHGLQSLTVVDVDGRDTDEEGQSVRVRQDVHLGARLAPVHGARTCVFAPVTVFAAPQWGSRSPGPAWLVPLADHGRKSGVTGPGGIGKTADQGHHRSRPPWVGACLRNVDAGTLMPQARPGKRLLGSSMNREGKIDVYFGLDVGKGEHRGTTLTPAGKKVLDKPLPNSEPKLRELFEKLQTRHGTVLVVVDQPASIGALPLAVARDVGCRVAYLPGLTMRRIADLYPGESKTDARDAAIIADAARTMPHTLRDLASDDKTVAELNMLAGFDDDLASEVSRIKNRLRGLLTRIHPSLERVLGPRLDHPAVLFLPERPGSPAQLRKAGKRRLISTLRPKAPRMAERLVADIFDALDEQTVVVPGTDAAALIVPSLAASLSAVLDQRRVPATRIEELLEAHPLAGVLTSMPGNGVRTAARVLIDIGDGSSFATAGHLAAYAGLAPATRRSGSSIRGEHPSRRGNKQLKRAFYLAASASLSQPDSRAYDAGDIDEADVVQAMQHGLVQAMQHSLVQAAPDTGSGPDQEPTVSGRLGSAAAPARHSH